MMVKSLRFNHLSGGILNGTLRPVVLGKELLMNAGLAQR